MKPEVKSFSKLEELRTPSVVAQRLLARHLSRSRLILGIELTEEQEQSSGEGFRTLLESAKGLFLWDRFLAIGISTLVDLKHLAGLTTLWEYRDLLGVGMGIFRFGRNWAFMTTFLYRVRKEEEGTLGTVLSHPFSRAGLYRDKYRSLNDTLWRTKASKSVKMVDLDSDAEEGPSKPTPVAPAKGKLFTPKEVIRARAANLLNLPRFR